MQERVGEFRAGSEHPPDALIVLLLMNALLLSGPVVELSR